MFLHTCTTFHFSHFPHKSVTGQRKDNIPSFIFQGHSISCLWKCRSVSSSRCKSNTSEIAFVRTIGSIHALQISAACIYRRYTLQKTTVITRPVMYLLLNIGSTLRQQFLQLKISQRRNVTDDFVNYAFRKEIIAENPVRYYPPILSTRGIHPILRIPEFIKKFKGVDFSKLPERQLHDTVQIEGKVKAIRRAGKAMFFIDIVQDEIKVQICASNKLLKNISSENFAQIHSFIRKGDHVTCIGYPSVTKVGELTLKASSSITVSSPCLNSVKLPEKIVDRKLINKNRVMNYIIDPTLRQKIRLKGIITRAIRDFLDRDGFLEVQTPILAGAGTGANAEPFETRLKAISSEKLLLRVAPELWLKKLVIGGFDKVFEIGPNFRNEGIDSTHNPEFLTCEFYRSFTNLAELMKMTEDIFAFIHLRLSEQSNLILLVSQRLEKLKSFKSGKFPKFEFIPTLESRTGHKLPADLTRDNLVNYYAQIGLEVPPNLSPANLLDNLSGIYLESLSTELEDTPVFIYNQPSVMSPLAKSSNLTYEGREYEVSLRFELFINGREYVNSYEEENSPFAQAEKFKLQQELKDNFLDNESIVPDWNYVKQMEYGLPPTGGWGCGIDRLSMLFSDSNRIEDVLTFGTLRDVVRQ